MVSPYKNLVILGPHPQLQGSQASVCPYCGIYKANKQSFPVVLEKKEKKRKKKKGLQKGKLSTTLFKNVYKVLSPVHYMHKGVRKYEYIMKCIGAMKEVWSDSKKYPIPLS